MKAHLVGGGIASLTAAAYLIKDGGLLGGNIHIYESSSSLGGCLRGYGDASHGYFIPVGRMFEENYRCTVELLSFLPSVSDPSRSIWEEMQEFHDRHGWYDKTRLIREGATVIDASDFGISLADKLAMTRLLLTPEAMLEGMRAGECFRIEAPLPARVDFLLRDYVYFLEDPDWLNRRLDALKDLRGKETVSRWQAQASDGNWRALVGELLEAHYDPLYERSQNRNYSGFASPQVFQTNTLSTEGISAVAKAIVANAES